MRQQLPLSQSLEYLLWGCASLTDSPSRLFSVGAEGLLHLFLVGADTGTGQWSQGTQNAFTSVTSSERDLMPTVYESLE